MASPPSQQEWGRHRSTICQLYFVQNEPLRKVREIMAEQYGLCATERMFKARLKSWNVRKNCTAREMTRILKIVQERSEIGKETTVRVRGVEIPPTKLRKFRNRKHHIDQDLTAGSCSGSSTPSDISCFTPRQKPVTDGTLNVQQMSNRADKGFYTADYVPQLQLPEIGVPSSKVQMHRSFHEALPELFPHQNSNPMISETPLFSNINGLQETFSHVPMSILSNDENILWNEMFMNMDAYFESYFRSSAWTPHSTQSVNFDGDEIQNPSNMAYLGMIEANKDVFDFTNPGSLVTLYEVACLLYQREDAEAAERLINQASDLVEVLLKNEHPQLLSCLFLVVSILEAKNEMNLVNQLLDFTHEKATAIHGETHPIPRIISCCARAATPFQSTTPFALKGTWVTFAKLIGQHHTYTLRLRQLYAWSLFQQGQLEAALSELRTLQVVYRNLAGEDHIHSRHTLFATAHVYTAQGHLDAAEETFQEVYRLSEQKYGREPPVMINVECLRMLAVVYHRQQKFEEVLPTLCRALPVAIKLLGRDHPTVLLIGHDLKKSLRYESTYVRNLN